VLVCAACGLEHSEGAALAGASAARGFGGVPRQHPIRKTLRLGRCASLQMPRPCWLLAASVALTLFQTADSDLPVTHSNLQIDRTTSLGSVQSADGAGDGGEESCGCEDDFPPGAGFAFRREGYAIVAIEGGKVARQRKFFENERVTFKEILAPGDGKTFPQVQLWPGRDHAQPRCLARAFTLRSWYAWSCRGWAGAELTMLAASTLDTLACANLLLVPLAEHRSGSGQC